MLASIQRNGSLLIVCRDWKLDQFLVSADKSHVVVADVDSVYITDIGMKKVIP